MSAHQDAAAVGADDERTTGLDAGSDAEGDAAVDSASSGRDPTLCADDVFHLLQNARRRGVLRYVRERPETESFEMRDIAEQVAAWEQDKPVAAITSTERQRVYIALYQSHLPKLDEHGVIEYEQSRGTVRPTGLAGEIGRYLDVDGTPEGPTDAPTGSTDSATRYYGCATVFSVLLAAATWVGLVPSLLTSYVGAVVTSLFAAVTLAVGLRRRPM
ncbi:hypothetical protein ACFO0N_17730 [Halobium salinum]|uniref:DUF7344 domain-containing protein n=1 Tax=Halobium salinum TaxID=1364940 RepID=A0ABD5PGF3_9EURY|nr:hypothetical protein [Halobium salinum]